MAVNSGEECPEVHSFVVLPDVSYVEVPNVMKSNVCSNAEHNSQNNANLKVDRLNSYAPCCSLDIDIEKGKEDSVANEESAGSWKSDEYLAREAFFQNGGKFMQLLMNLGSDLPKFTLRDKFVAERVHETPTHKTRKYKRYPSFNSRRVVLLFSVLSSIGTIILIYLTLRVRQINDGTANV